MWLGVGGTPDRTVIVTAHPGGLELVNVAAWPGDSLTHLTDGRDAFSDLTAVRWAPTTWWWRQLPRGVELLIVEADAFTSLEVLEVRRCRPVRSWRATTRYLHELDPARRPLARGAPHRGALATPTGGRGSDPREKVSRAH